mgnify:CR=1 FL=1
MVDDRIYYFSSYRTERDVMSWEERIKKSIRRDIENIISDIQRLLDTDADNNAGKVPHLQSAIKNLEEAMDE